VGVSPGHAEFVPVAAAIERDPGRHRRALEDIVDRFIDHLLDQRMVEDRLCAGGDDLPPGRAQQREMVSVPVLIACCLISPEGRINGSPDPFRQLVGVEAA
jgi:hypothetical protein